MAAIPEFTDDGLLPAGDYEVTLDELRHSILVVGPKDKSGQSQLGRPWRGRLVDNLEVMVRQLWRVGVTEIFIDGSFAEDKDHPNDIDGYFVCDLMRLASGELQRELNLLDPHKVWTWDPASRRPYRGYPRSNCPCGTSIAWSFIRISAGMLVGHPGRARQRVGVPVGVSTVAPGRKAPRHCERFGGRP